jgi:hypothetical protein
MALDEPPAAADAPPRPDAETVWTAPQGIEEVAEPLPPLAEPGPAPPAPGEMPGPPARYDELGDDEWLRHLRGGEPDGAAAAPPALIGESAGGEPSAPAVEVGPTAGTAEVKPLTPPVGWSQDLSQVDLFRSALEDVTRTPAGGLAPQDADAVDSGHDEEPSSAEQAQPDAILPAHEPGSAAAWFSAGPARLQPPEPIYAPPDWSEPLHDGEEAVDDEVDHEVDHDVDGGVVDGEVVDPAPATSERAEPDVDDVDDVEAGDIDGEDGADDDAREIDEADESGGAVESDEADESDAVEEAEGREPEAGLPDPLLARPFTPPPVTPPVGSGPLDDQPEAAPFPDRPSFGRAPAQRLSEAPVRDEDHEEPDDDEPLRGTLAPVLRRSTERARYPTSTTPVIRPPVMPPPPPGEGSPMPPPPARAVSWEQALAGDVLPGKKRRPQGVGRSKPRHESGGPGEEYRPVKPAPDRSLTLLVVTMLLVLIGLVAAAAWTFWPRTSGAAGGTSTDVAGAPRTAGGP